MNGNIISWIFTIGTILGYFIMVIHSMLVNQKGKTYFIFGGEVIIAYVLEFFLVNIQHYYSYSGLPLQIFGVPIIIPLGWILTFYGLFNIVQDFKLDFKNKTRNQIEIIVYSGILAFFFGFSIEILAKIANLWSFNFNQFNIIGIPISVPFAWAFTIMAYSFGLILFEKKPNLFILILIIVLLLNIVFAFLVMLIF